MGWHKLRDPTLLAELVLFHLIISPFVLTNVVFLALYSKLVLWH